MEGLNKAYGDRLLIENLSFKLPPGGIVGIIGPNGAGKTTLFRMILPRAGKARPAAPSRSRLPSTSVTLTSRVTLDPNATVWQEISGGNDIVTLGRREMNSRAYVGAFNFWGGDQQQEWEHFRAGSATACVWRRC